MRPEARPGRLLAGGAGPFRYRSRVRELLGVPLNDDVTVVFAIAAPSGRFSYLRPVSPLHGPAAPALSAARWLDQAARELATPPSPPPVRTTRAQPDPPAASPAGVRDHATTDVTAAGPARTPGHAPDAGNEPAPLSFPIMTRSSVLPAESPLSSVSPGVPLAASDPAGEPPPVPSPLVSSTVVPATVVPAALVPSAVAGPVRAPVADSSVTASHPAGTPPASPRPTPRALRSPDAKSSAETRHVSRSREAPPPEDLEPTPIGRAFLAGPHIGARPDQQSETVPSAGPVPPPEPSAPIRLTMPGRTVRPRPGAAAPQPVDPPSWPEAEADPVIEIVERTLVPLAEHPPQPENRPSTADPPNPPARPPRAPYDPEAGAIAFWERCHLSRWRGGILR
ncbi:hypothetical protein ABZ907_38870 [Nonomuraea wenchangensis]